jgi:hypothetical protein
LETDRVHTIVVLPGKFRERLASELEKRLDLDFDEILESPKLRLQLSPFELDKSLLELYDKVAQGASGDVLRVIGGGGPVALQNLYMKRLAAKSSRREGGTGASFYDIFPSFAGEVDPDERERTATQGVRWALRRNLPRINNNRAPRKNPEIEPESQEPQLKNRQTPSMCLGAHMPASPQPTTWAGLRSPSSMQLRSAPRASKFSILI